jgi:hypothetical protein
MIWIDGSPKGNGPVTYSDTKTVGSTTFVRIEKEGCQHQNYSFSRSEELAVGPFIGAILVLVPVLWVMKYQPEHYFEYTCEPTK